MIIGIIMVVSGLLSAAMNFYLARGGLQTLEKMKQTNGMGILWVLIVVPFYVLTEFFPAISYAFVIKKYD